MSSTNNAASGNTAAQKKGFGLRNWLIVGALIVGAFWVIGVRNDIVGARQDVLAQFGQVQNVMERRSNVLINVANTATAAAKNERGALTDIAEARASATSALNIAKSMDLSKLSENAELQKKFFEAMATQQQAILKLSSIVEAYPEIKATALYARLQDEVVGSENRVAFEQRKSQGLIRTYNGKIVIFPGSVIASAFGYKEMAYYQASPEAQRAPDLGNVLNRK